MNKARILLIDKDTTTTKYLGQELAKANFEVFTANIVKEGLILAYQHRPHVIVLDPNIKFSELEELMTKFKKDLRLNRSKVIAFSSLTSPQEIQSALDLKFHEYIAKEINALPRLVESAKKAGVLTQERTRSLQRRKETLPAVQEEFEKHDGKIIVFLSSKGGVGTSSLCANIANLVSKNREKKIIVIDLVLPIGSIASIVGKPDTVTIIETAKMHPNEVTSEWLKDKLPTLNHWNFKLLAGSSNPEDSFQVDIANIPIILESLKKISDYIFIDLGKSLSKVSLPILKSADQIVLTLSLDKSTVAQTKAVWQYLKEKGIMKEKVYFLINRAVSLEGLSKSEVEQDLDLVIPLTVPYMGRDFTLANNLNQPIGDKFPQDAVTISLRQASEDIIRRIDENLNKNMSSYF